MADIVLALGMLGLGTASGMLACRLRIRFKAIGPMHGAVGAVCERLEDPACVWEVKQYSSADPKKGKPCNTYTLSLLSDEDRKKREELRAARRAAWLGSPTFDRAAYERYENTDKEFAECLIIGYPPQAFPEPVRGTASDVFTRAELRMIAASAAVAMRYDLMRKTGHLAKPEVLQAELDE